MSLKVFSGVIIADPRFTVDLNLKNRSVKEKCDFLDTCAERAEAAFAQLNNGALASEDLRILVGPEYLFGLPQSDAGFNVNAYTEEEHEQIVSRCTALSARFPQLLMIPGTVLFKRRLTRDQRKQVTEQLQGKLAAIKKTVGEREPMLVVEGDRGIKNVRLKGYGIMERLGKRDPRLFGYNRAYVYYGGSRIKTFNKADNANEFGAEDPKPTLIPGLSKNIFHYPGRKIKLGLEICADKGRLSSLGEQVDIRIVISAAILLQNTDVPNSESKLIINCLGSSSSAKYSGALRAPEAWTGLPITDGPRFKALNLTLEQVPVQHSLRCQVMELDVSK